MRPQIVWTVEVYDEETHRRTLRISFGACESNARAHARALKAQPDPGGYRTVELIKVVTTRTVVDLHEEGQ